MVVCAEEISLAFPYSENTAAKDSASFASYGVVMVMPESPVPTLSKDSLKSLASSVLSIVTETLESDTWIFSGVAPAPIAIPAVVFDEDVLPVESTVTTL